MLIVVFISVVHRIESFDSPKRSADFVYVSALKVFRFVHYYDYYLILN